MQYFKIFNQSGKKIKIMRSNKGGNYYSIYDESGWKSGPFVRILEENGIVAQYSLPSTPQQSDIVERHNCMLIYMVRTMISNILLPILLWEKL